MNKRSTEETSRDTVAEQVVTRKRLYFMPEHGVSVEAEDADSAVRLVKNKKAKVGDGQISR